MRKGREVALSTKKDFNQPFAVVVSHSVAAPSFALEPFCSLLQKGFVYYEKKIFDKKTVSVGAFYGNNSNTGHIRHIQNRKPDKNTP